MNCIKLQGILLSVILTHSISTTSVAANNTQNISQETNISLNQMLERALLTSPAIKAAQEKLEAELARSRSLGQALYNPELELEYENAEEVTKSIGLNQQIDWQGKRSSNQNLGRVRVDIARLKLTITRNGFMGEVARAISTYTKNQEMLSIRNRILESATRLKLFAEKQHSSGDSTLKELQTARLALLRARTDKNNSYADFLRARQVLMALTGREANQWKPVNFTEHALPSLDQVSQQLPALKLTRLQFLKQKAQVRVVEKKYVDDPTIGVKYGKEGKNDLFGVKLSMPLPVRRSNRFDLLAAKREMQAADFELDNQERVLEANLAANHSRISALQKSWQEWDSQGDQSLSTQYDLLNSLLENGELSTLNYLLEIEQLLRTEESIVELKFNLETAWIDWFEQTNGFNAWI